MNSDFRYDVNQRRVVMANGYLCTLPSLIIVYLPWLVGGMVTTLGFTEQQSGFVATADMAGYTIGGVIFSFFVVRSNWRYVGLGCLILMIATNLASVFIGDYYMLMALRFFSGFGGGALTAVIFATIGQMREPDSALGVWLIFQSILGSAGMFLFPYILESYGVGGGYMLMVVFLVGACFLIHYVPPHAIYQEEATPKIIPEKIKYIALGVLAIGVIYLSLTAVYTYMERIGDAAGVTPEQIGVCFSLSALSGLLGAGAAVHLGSRFGRVKPVVVSVIGLSVAFFVMMMDSMGFYLFMFASVLNYIAWTFLIAYMFGSMAAVDSSGRATAYGNVAMGGGLTLGPFVAAFQIGGDSYDRLIIIGLVMLIIGFFIFLPSLAYSENH